MSLGPDRLGALKSLDVPPGVDPKRLKKRGRKVDRFDPSAE